MNITKESTGNLTALVKIEIVPSDYTDPVDKQLADYKKKAKLPGFRPGYVPTGLIRKMYGKAIVADEVNRLISTSLSNYIKDENLNILGNPLPNAEKNAVVDFDHNDTFEFYFDLGLTPEFHIPLDQDMNIEDYSIAVDDEMVNKYITETRKRFGKTIQKALPEEPAVVGDNEFINAEIDQKTDLELSEEQKEEQKEPAIELAELNPDFYNAVYPGLDIQTQEDFFEQVRKEAAARFNTETDKLLFNKITLTLIKETRMDLPDEFLKRWLADNNEGKYTPEEIEKNYPGFVESIKWQLIENKIIRTNNIIVTDQEIRNYISTNMLRQINMSELDPEMQKKYESIIDSFMQNKDQVQRINDQLYNEKLMEFFKTNLKFHQKEVSYEEYINIASELHEQHDHEHHHDHHHDHEHDHEHNHEHK